MQDFASPDIIHEIFALSQLLPKVENRIKNKHTATEKECVSSLRAIYKVLCDKTEEGFTQKAGALSSEINAISKEAGNMESLRTKLLQAQTHIRDEKKARRLAEERVQVVEKRMSMLADHIERLMIALRNMSNQHSGILHQYKKSTEEVSNLHELLSERNSLIQKKTRCIEELQTGSGILEEQLRLMDQKYLELRSKLDYAREFQRKYLTAAQQEAKDLRVKYAQEVNGKCLDDVQLICPNCNRATNQSWMSDNYQQGSPYRTPAASPMSRPGTAGSRPKSANNTLRKSKDGFVASMKRINSNTNTDNVNTTSSDVNQIISPIRKAKASEGQQTEAENLDRIIKKIYLKNAQLKDSADWQQTKIKELLAQSR